MVQKPYTVELYPARLRHNDAPRLHAFTRKIEKIGGRVTDHYFLPHAHTLLCRVFVTEEQVPLILQWQMVREVREPPTPDISAPIHP